MAFDKSYTQNMWYHFGASRFLASVWQSGLIPTNLHENFQHKPNYRLKVELANWLQWGPFILKMAERYDNGDDDDKSDGDAADVDDDKEDIITGSMESCESFLVLYSQF